MFLPASIQIGSLVLNNTDHGSNVSIGATKKLNRRVSAKKTQGQGQQHGDGVLRFATISLVLDDDLSDVYNSKADK